MDFLPIGQSVLNSAFDRFPDHIGLLKEPGRAALTRRGNALSALLRCHHEDAARYKGNRLAPALGALQFRRFMLGDGLGALEPFPAFLATILVGRHGFASSR